MFIKTFEDVRKFMIDKSHINVFVDYSLSNLFGSIMVDPAFYVLEKGNSDEKDAWFVSLDQYTRTPKEKFKKDFCLQALSDHISGIDNEHNYTIPQSKLKIIKTWPFIYWISDEFREKFESLSIDKYFKVSQGMSVSNGERFLRFNWELNSSNIVSSDKASNGEWARFPKGGPFKKWSGNLWLCVNWKDDGAELKSFKKAVLRNPQYYFVEGLTYSSSGSKGATFRTLPSNAVISGGGRDSQNKWWIFQLFLSGIFELQICFLHNRLPKSHR